MSLADEFLADANGAGSAVKRGSLAEAFMADAKGAPTPAQARGTGSDLIDAGNAVGTGFWKNGMLGLAGLPVDTIQNVIDLGKAGVGSAYQAATGKPAPDALSLRDRKDVVGSHEWLLEQARKTQAGQVMTQAANPEYEGGYLQAAGAGLAGVIAPNSAAQAANQAIMGVSSTLAGKAAMDSTGNPAWAAIAGMAPTGAQNAVTTGAKAFARGANPFSSADMEAKRQAMEQRMLILRDAGVENPTLGLATGNKFVGGIENLLQSTPGAVGAMARSRDAALQGMQDKTMEAAQLSSPNRGALESGVAIQGGIKDWKGFFKQGQQNLYSRLDQHIDPQFPTRVDNTLGTFSRVNSDIQGAPAVSQFFKNSKIRALEDAFKTDTSGSPETVMVVPQPPKAGGGIMNAPFPQEPLLVKIPAGPARNTLPWQAVKQTRTMVGNEIADHSLVSDVPRSKWDALYGGLSEDMGNAARAADQASSSLTPNATNAFNRANNYTRAGMERLDRVAPFANATAPEQAYTAMVNASKENVSTLQAVKKTLPPDARGTVAGTIIERLGKATNGVQNAEGTAWSPETFLTNWNKMTPNARQELFSGFPNSAEVAHSVESVAKATDMMRSNSKMWANPSGSGANLAARATFGALLGGAGLSATSLLNPAVPAGAAMVLGGNKMLANALTSPDVVNSVARNNVMSQQRLTALVNALRQQQPE